MARWPVLFVLAAVSTIGQGANVPFVGVVSNAWEQVLVWALCATECVAFAQRGVVPKSFRGGASPAVAVAGGAEALLGAEAAFEHNAESVATAFA